MRHALQALAALVLATAVADASAQAPRCRVEPFSGSGLPGGAVAEMSVVNTAKTCSIANYGIPSERKNPADSGNILAAPTHGTAAFVGHQAQYTPAPGYVGEDEFKYEAFARDNINRQVRMLVTVKVTVRAP